METKRIKIKGKYYYAVRDAKGRFIGTFKKRPVPVGGGGGRAGLVKFYLVVDYETDEAAGHDLKLEFYAVGKKGSIEEFQRGSREALEKHFGKGATDTIMDFATFGEEKYTGGAMLGINEEKSDSRFVKNFSRVLVREARKWKL